MIMGSVQAGANPIEGSSGTTPRHAYANQPLDECVAPATGRSLGVALGRARPLFDAWSKPEK